MKYFSTTIVTVAITLLSFLPPSKLSASVYSITCLTRAVAKSDIVIPKFVSDESSIVVNDGDATKIVMSSRSKEGLKHLEVILTYMEGNHSPFGRIRVAASFKNGFPSLETAGSRVDGGLDSYSSISLPIGIPAVQAATIGSSISSMNYRMTCTSHLSLKALRTRPNGRLKESFGEGPEKRAFDELPIESELIIPADLSLPDTVEGSTSELVYRENDSMWCERTIPPGMPEAGEASFRYRCVDKTCD